MTEIRDLSGKRFGRLIVTSEYTKKDSKISWKCVCDCGKETIKQAGHLVAGDTQSCGCLMMEVSSSRSKIGDRELKMTRDILSEIRKIVLSTKVKRQLDMVGIIYQKYPQFATKSIPGYINACSVSDRIFQLYLDGKFSLGMILILGTCDPPSTADFLADEAVERNMSTGQIAEAKSLMKSKKCRSWDEAIKQAMGVIEEREPTPPREKKNQYQTAAGKISTELPQSFDALVQDILVSGTNWRMKVQMAIDMMPMASKSGEYGFSVLSKLYMLRHVLKENLEFVDKNVKDALSQTANVGGMTGNDADITAKEITHESGRDDHSGRGERGSGDPEAVPEGHGQAFPSAGPRVIQGEGRIRS